jgi:hypothetical protein
MRPGRRAPWLDTAALPSTAVGQTLLSSQSDERRPTSQREELHRRVGTTSHQDRSLDSPNPAEPNGAAVLSLQVGATALEWLSSFNSDDHQERSMSNSRQGSRFSTPLNVATALYRLPPQFTSC